jgi:hypothetical protein
LALARAIVRGSKLLILDEGNFHRLCFMIISSAEQSLFLLQQHPLLVIFVSLPSENSQTYRRVADYKTDTIIQRSLRNELKGDVTLITVAHRLQTIIDADKVVRGPSLPYQTWKVAN